MAWWNATSVTVSNNQNVVVVNAADNIGLISDGDALVIAGQIVEVERAYFDNNNNPRILLTQDWTSGNQNNQPAKAIPIPADLRKAVQYLRDVGQDAIVFSEAMARILASTDQTLTIPTATSGDVVVVPYGRLVQQVNDLLATMGTFGVPLYGTNSKNQARTLLGLQPQITAQPTLDLDFANNNLRVYEPFGLTRKTLTEALTTTRNSTATYNSPLGIATAAASIPRIEYDLATGECLGLLAEEQRTNVLLYSNNMLTSPWAHTAPVVVTEDTVTPPIVKDGTCFNVAGANGVGFNDPNLRTDITITPDLLYQFTIWVYPSTACNKISLRSNSNALGLTSATLTLDVIPNQWQRLSMPCARSTAALTVTISSSGATVAGAPFKVSAAQLEAGAFPTSNIKTEGSQVTRLSDGPVRSSQLDSIARSLTVYCELDVLSLNSTNSVPILSVTDSANTVNRALVHISHSTGGRFDLYQRNSVGSANSSVELSNSTGKYKIAGKYDSVAGKLRICVNGVLGGEGTTNLSPESWFGFLQLFPIQISGTSSNIRRLQYILNAKYFPRALSDQELIDLTAV